MKVSNELVFLLALFARVSAVGNDLFDEKHGVKMGVSNQECDDAQVRSSALLVDVDQHECVSRPTCKWIGTEVVLRNTLATTLRSLSGQIRRWSPSNIAIESRKDTFLVREHY